MVQIIHLCLVIFKYSLQYIYCLRENTICISNCLKKTLRCLTPNCYSNIIELGAIKVESNCFFSLVQSPFRAE